MKKFIIVIFLFFNIKASFAQDNDSLIFSKAAWSTEKITNKIHLYTFHFSNKELFYSNQYISFIEVKKGWFKPKFHIAAEPKILRKTSDFAKNNQAVVAINGNFFDVKNGGAVDYTKVNNKIVNTNRINKNERRDFHQRAAVIVKRGKIYIKKWDGTSDWQYKLNAENIMLNGPLLIYNHIDESLDSSAFNKNRHPRSCVGIKADGRVIMLVADGRSPNAQGLSLFELTKLMRWLGCTDAVNFDGGGSSSLWVKEKGIVNHPSDNKLWDHDGERKVANVLYVK